MHLCNVDNDNTLCTHDHDEKKAHKEKILSIKDYIKVHFMCSDETSRLQANQNSYVCMPCNRYYWCKIVYVCYSFLVAGHTVSVLKVVQYIIRINRWAFNCSLPRDFFVCIFDTNIVNRV